MGIHRKDKGLREILKELVSEEEIFQEIEMCYIEDDEKAREVAKAIHALVIKKLTGEK